MGMKFNYQWSVSGLLLCVLAIFSPAAFAQPRLAILDFTGSIEASNELRNLAQKSDFALVDPQQLQTALKGAHYNGSLNLSLDEARALGLSIGCDYYLIGLAKVQRRLISEKDFYFDVMIGAFVVETQSGKLIRFSFEKARTEKEFIAQKQLTELTEKIWRQSVDAIKSDSTQKDIHQNLETYDLSSEEAVKLNIKPPQFFRRLKPSYTPSADLAGIAATVELKVIFRSDGQIGEIEVIRWGGFDLDESALATARQLKFEPAKLNGRPINVSAVVQYNFRKEEKGK